MSFRAGGQVPGKNGGKEAGGAGFESHEGMNAFAREYFAADFPNPERAGCPAPGALQELIRADKPPGAELRAHLFGCSECFTEFDRAMRARADVLPVAPSWWGRLKGSPLLRPTPLVAGALCLLLVASAGVYLRNIYRRTSAPDVVAAQPDKVEAPAVKVPTAEATKDDPTPQATPEASTAQVTTGARAEKVPRPGAKAGGRTPSSSRPGAAREDTGKPPAIETVAVDLNEHTVLRGGAGGDAFTLPRSNTRLKLTLPEGGAAGPHRVSILDASGKTLVTANARSADGRALEVVLDTRKLAPQKYLLRLSRGGDVPQYFPFVIVEGAEGAP